LGDIGLVLGRHAKSYASTVLASFFLEGIWDPPVMSVDGYVKQKSAVAGGLVRMVVMGNATVGRAGSGSCCRRIRLCHCLNSELDVCH